MIEAKDLVKRYSVHLAVDHLSFTVEKGHIVGFLGPNGAGKSTTMNMITGYISATEGNVSINGYDVYEEPEKAKKCIGYLPEQPPLYPNMTVREYLNFVADLKGVKKKEKAEMINDIIKRVQLGQYTNRLIKQLSKGYKQRVGLAQAMVGYPEVLILDEPTVGLDPIQIIEIRELIKDLSKEHTIILSSHILQEVSAVCDTIIIINNGKLLVNDSVENLGQYISNTKGLQLVVKGTKEAVDGALAGIENINRVVYGECSEPNCVSLTLFPEEGADVREQLFPAMLTAGCSIQQMKEEESSLESIFLALTQENEEKEEHEDAGDL